MGDIGDARPIPRTLPAGTVAGEYEIVELLGEGGMGQVFSAIHPVIGRRVAVKVLLPKFSSDVEAVERFVTEARAANHIGHPNIVDVFAFGKLDDGRHFMVMELLVGESLKARIARAPLPEAEALDIADQIASGLIAAHAKGIVHRDLKPDNIFLVGRDDDRVVVKLLDFGIAKLMLGDDDRVIKTQTGVMIGTPAYMAPEQARGEQIQETADLYSFGIVLYEALTGTLPFVANNMVEMLFNHATVEPPRPSALVAVRPDVDDLVVALMAKQPADRPSLRAVRAVTRTTHTPVSVVAVAPPARRRRGPLVLGPLIVAGGALAGYAVISNRSNDEHPPPVDAAPAPKVEPPPTKVEPAIVEPPPRVEPPPPEPPPVVVDPTPKKPRPVPPRSKQPAIESSPPPPVGPPIDKPAVVEPAPPVIDKPAPPPTPPPAQKKDKDGLMVPNIPGAKK